MKRIDIPLKLKLEIIKLHDQLAKEKDLLVSLDVTTFPYAMDRIGAYISNGSQSIDIKLNKSIPAYDDPDCTSFIASEEDVKQYIKKLRTLLKNIKADNHNRLPRNRYSF